MRRWTVEDSRELYQVEAWGAGLFDVDDATGHVVVTTERGRLDLKQIVDDCLRRGIRLPLLIRLPDVLQARVDALGGTFVETMERLAYGGAYRGVYPIKVNQERHIVDDFIRSAKRWHFGLECGSKPELQIALALQDDPEALIVINGYKDEELISMAVAARELGRRTVIVVEQPYELPMILKSAAAVGVPPAIGARIKLGSTGAGRWRHSSGDRAKFGLTMHQLVELVEELKKADSLSCFELLHYHIGSQVTNIRAVREAVHEGARVFCELYRMGAPLRYLDVGGGLGVDYDGSRTDFPSSMNYDLREYVQVVVETIKSVCEREGVPHPDIVTESGRSLVAHSAVLVTSVLGTTNLDSSESSTTVKEAAAKYASAKGLAAIHEDIDAKNPQRSYHAALAIKEDTFARFLMGSATLEERAIVDAGFNALCAKLLRLHNDDGEPLHEELEHLPRALADIYFCNFSVFQSVPDSWAVSQLFPIMPLARLEEKPTRRAVLADLTCDSDGKIDRFIDARDVKPTLDVHALDGQPYYLGIFLLGAYQETLGDLHNLFGDTHAIHVRAIPEHPGYVIDAMVEGDSVEEVLGYMQYDRKSLVESLRRSIEDAYARGMMTFEAGNRLMEAYVQRLRSYTYLE